MVRLTNDDLREATNEVNRASTVTASTKADIVARYLCKPFLRFCTIEVGVDTYTWGIHRRISNWTAIPFFNSTSCDHHITACGRRVPQDIRKIFYFTRFPLTPITIVSHRDLAQARRYTGYRIRASNERIDFPRTTTKWLLMAPPLPSRGSRFQCEIRSKNVGRRVIRDTRTFLFEIKSRNLVTHFFVRPALRLTKVT